MNQPIDFVSTHPFLYYSNRGLIATNKNKDMKIDIGAVVEDDIWSGSNAVILPGITVGRGVVIVYGMLFHILMIRLNL